MSDPNVSAEQLKLFIERIETLEEEKQGVADAIRDVMAELKMNGYDPKIVRKILRIRKMNSSDRMQEEALLQVYLDALGMG
jgi:uncharacterized protein (UPF0335 family)